MWSITREEIANLVSRIDYSEALTVTAGKETALQACRDALRYGFRAVVAFPWNLGVLADELKGTGILAQIPVGFPTGCVTTEVKRREVQEGLERGASDVDMVMNLGAFLSGDYRKTADDIKGVAEMVRQTEAPFKVIIEIGVLTDEQIVTASKLVRDCGADFVKTCTGFGPGRATVHAVELIKETVGADLQIKASGGIASIEDGVSLMRAGADVAALRHPLVDQLQRLNWDRKQ